MCDMWSQKSYVQGTCGTRRATADSCVRLYESSNECRTQSNTVVYQLEYYRQQVANRSDLFGGYTLSLCSAATWLEFLPFSDHSEFSVGFLRLSRSYLEIGYDCVTPFRRWLYLCIWVVAPCS